MDRLGFYLLFIPGLAILTLGIGVGFSVLAYTQGPFQPATKRGLISMTAVAVLVAGLALLAFRIDHLSLPTR